MKRIVISTKNYIFHGLISRLFVPIIILLLFGAVLIRGQIIDSFNEFSDIHLAQEYDLLADGIFMINEHALDELFRGSTSPSKIDLAVLKAKLMRRLALFYEKYDLAGGIVENGEILFQIYSNSTANPLVFSAQEVDSFKDYVLSSLQYRDIGTVTISNRQFFVYKIHFKYLNWDIVYFREALHLDVQQSKYDKEVSLYILLFCFMVLLTWLIYVLILKPVSNIVTAVNKMQPPNYKGVVEFEVLSDHTRTSMEKLYKSIDIAKEADQIKANFLANMSHEIRTPLNAIIGFGHIALLRELAPDVRDYFVKINNASQSLMSIVNDILDYSKIDADKLAIEHCVFSLNEQLSYVIDLNLSLAQKNNVEFVILGQTQVAEQLYGDALRLKQVLLNLLSNAMKFTRNGRVILSLEQKYIFGKPKSIKFIIQDTGIGMTEKQLSQLFQPFSQADVTTTRKYGGTGLGLTISKKLIELMGGELQVKSELGVGSCFCFELELCVKDYKPFCVKDYKPRLITTPLYDESLKLSRFLMVGVNINTQKAINEIACSLAFPIEACSAQEALIGVIDSVSISSRYDFILLDHQIGEDAIINISQQLKDSDSEKAPFIIVLTSALNNSERLTSSVSAFLPKPVTVHSLLTKMKACITDINLLHVIKNPPKQALLGINILLAEDNIINQQVAVELLKLEGALVTVVNNGLEALEIITERGTVFDLVLMDIQMPIMDGYQATKKIRQQYDAQQLPIIALSANAQSDDLKKSAACGLNAHISKPFSPQNLYQVILDNCGKPAMHSKENAPKKRVKVNNELFPAVLLASGSLINIPLAIDRVGGSGTFLVKLLKQFYQNHQHDMRIINSAFINNDFKEIQRIAHTLKGVSATIGAEELYLSAAKLEVSAKNKRSQCQGNIDKLASCLTLLLTALSSLVDGGSLNEKIVTATDANSNQHVDIATLTPHFIALESALSDGEFSAKGLLSQLQNKLQKTPFSDDLLLMIELVDNFKFTDAQNILLAIAKTLTIEIEQESRNDNS